MGTNTLEGKTIGGKYRLGKMIGRGGMGAVYEGIHLGLGNMVAIKVLHSSSNGDDQQLDNSIRRFRREGKAAAQVISDHVVRVSDIDYDAVLEVHYMVMEHVAGVSLKDLLAERHRLTVTETVDILRQTLVALEAIHASRIIHRDLKPSNILLTKGNGRWLVKVCDFGISKIDVPVDGADDTLTAPSTMLGTLTYMPPEMFQGKENDTRSDLYTLGIITYEMLTGAPPFKGSPQNIMKGHLEQDPGSLRQRVQAKGSTQVFSASIEAFVAKALAKDRNKRHFSATAMRHALDACRLPAGSATKKVIVAITLMLIAGFAGTTAYRNSVFPSILDSTTTVSVPETPAPSVPRTVVTSIPASVAAVTAEPLAPPPVLQRAPAIASALAHLNAREYDEAAKELELLRTQSPRDPSILFHLGQAYAPQPNMAKKATEAFSAYLKAPGKKDLSQIRFAKGWSNLNR